MKLSEKICYISAEFIDVTERSLSTLHVHNLLTLQCRIYYHYIIIIIIKRSWQCKAGRERLTPYQSEDPNPTTPTHRKKEEKGKTEGDKK